MTGIHYYYIGSTQNVKFAEVRISLSPCVIYLLFDTVMPKIELSVTIDKGQSQWAGVF